MHSLIRTECIHRVNCSGVAVIVAITSNNELVLVCQLRRSSGRHIIELPAGLVGDIDVGEDMAFAAMRELEEETGYGGGEISLLGVFPSSTGVSSDVLHLYKATGLEKISKGGGVDGEDIETIVVPLSEVKEYLRSEVLKGNLVDSKVWLYNF